MPEKDILFKTKVSGDADQKLKNLNNEISKTAVTMQGKLTPSTQQANLQLQSLSRIVQDAPFGFMAVGNNITFMAEQMGMAKAQGIGLGAQLKGMASSLLGTGGIIFAISAAVSIITVLTRESGKAKEEVNKLREAFDELIKVQTPKGAFNVDPQKIDEAISKLQKAREEAYNYTKFWTEESGIQDKNVMMYDEAIKKLKEAKEQEEQRLKIIELLSSAGLTYTGELKKQTEEIRKQANKQARLLDVVAGGRTSSRASRGTPKGLMQEVGVPQKPGVILNNEDIKKEFQMVNGLIMSSAGVLRSEFMQAWQDIFGEANSLFEKLMANIIDQLLQFAATQLATSFLNMIFPGFSLFNGLFSPGNGGGGGGNSANQRIVIQFGDQEVGDLVRNGNDFNYRFRRN